jgi:glutaminyl-peptide cyclotransferase
VPAQLGDRRFDSRWRSLAVLGIVGLLGVSFASGELNATARSTPTKPGSRSSLVTSLATSVPTTLSASTTVPATLPPPPDATSVTKIVRTFPHDVTAFTEGFESKGGLVYESSGLYGTSRIQLSQLATGKVLASVALEPKMFAEGLARIPGDQIVQLTWREHVAIVRDARTLAETKRFSYVEEGWGLCYSANLKMLVHSDGTDTLRLRSAKDFSITGTVKVRYPGGRAPTALNELECVGNSVFVNVWQTKQILQIDLITGIVTRTIDASNLGPDKVTSPDDVLNGIAYLSSGRLLLTGKRWPLIYEVTLVDAPKK